MPEADPQQSLVELVERSRNRDQRAFEVLLRQLWPRVMFHVAGRGGIPAVDVDAVAFEVFAALYQAIRESHAPDGSRPAAFFACVRTIAKRRVSDFWRGRRPLPEAAMREVAMRREAAGKPPDEAEPEEWLAVEDCMGSLEDEPRLLIVLHYFQNLSTRKLASQTGKPASTVRLIISRALAVLADCLRSHGIVGDVVATREIVH